MTDFASLLRPDRGEPAHLVHLIDKAGASDWIARQPAPRRALLEALRFDGKRPGQLAILPITDGGFEVVAAVAKRERLTPWCLARLGEGLPAGTYRLAEGAPGAAALGWLLAQHRFDRYRTKAEPAAGPRILLSPEAAVIDRIIAEARATALVRDLVDTPASDLGPAELEAAVRAIGDESGAKVDVTRGDQLETGYPMIAAVGRGARTQSKAGRACLGPRRPSADRHHRQGRMLRQWRARYQVGERDAADEKGHGRRGSCPCACAIDH
jgi:leucyl aminopeptidase